jgi:hypothetical protein
VVRVRTLSPAGATQGFRAVVGMSGSGRDTADLGSRSSSCSAFLPAPADAHPDRQVRAPGTPPQPPLRC